MTQKLRWHDYISINIYWFALTSRSQVLTPLILPVLVQRFVGEAVKGTYVGQIRLWALMVALLMQALMGLLSDRSTSRWGRRRPFIAVGTGLEVLVLIGIASVTGLEGMTGYWVLFGLYIFSMISSNTAHAATQGLIPDLVPPDQRGRFSGVKALLELPVPLDLRLLRRRRDGGCREPFWRARGADRRDGCLCARDDGGTGSPLGRRRPFPSTGSP
jgi:MFS-type transporter involved in bile tolerance (Atg22 family)